jgi:tape measure domain-containing protein
MSDYQVTVGGDFQELLRGFQQLEARAQQAGQTVGKGLQEGIQGFSNRSLAALNAELNRLQSRQTRVDVNSAAFEKAAVRIREVQALIAAVERRRISLNADPGSIVALRFQLDQLNGDLSRVAIGGRRFRELQREIQGVERELLRAGEAGGIAAKGVGLLRNALGLIGGIGAGAALTGFLRSSVSEAIALESATRRLTNTLGQQGAGQALGFLKATSDQLGLSFRDLVGAYGRFTAAATAANVPIGQQQELFTAVSRAGMALGLTSDEVNGAFLALQQIASKGVVSMEELRQQLGERLPIALSATAKGLGLSQRELIKLVETGQLSADRFFPAFTKGLNELTAGAEAMPTAAQNLQRFQNAWQELQVSFGQNLLPTITAGVNQLTLAIKELKLQQEGFSLNLSGPGNGLSNQNAGLLGQINQIQEKYNLSEETVARLFRDTNRLARTPLDPVTGALRIDESNYEKVLGTFEQLVIAYRRQNKDSVSAANAEAAATQALTNRLEEQAKVRREAIGVTAQRGQIKALQDEAALVAQVTAGRITQADADRSIGAVRVQNLQRELNGYDQLLSKLREARAAGANNEKEILKTEAERAAKGLELAKAQQAASQAEVQRRREVLDLERQRLEVASTVIDLETQAGAQLKARLQSQRDFLNAVLGLQDAQARLTASEFGVESARQNAAITGAERHLQLMRDRGASAGAIAQQEQYIASLRRGAEAIERRALAAQIEAAAQRFQTERQVLAFKQAQEIIDARVAQAAARRNVLEQRQKLLELQQQAMDPSLSAEQSAILQQRINLQQQSLGLAQQQARDEAARIPVLAAIQSLERQTLGAQQQATANGLRAQAATRGWEQSLAGPLNRLDDAVSSSQQLGRALQSVTVGTITAGGETITLKENVAAVQDATQASASAAYGMAAGFDAANASATKLLGTLRQVSSVPQARWSGGPVDAGTSYRVNELGQEALLSPGGALSLINAPARSLWRAPSSGTVIPAGITAGLKAAGMFGGAGRAVVAGGGGSAGAGKLQQAIDRLSARMDALVAKNWDVRVTAPSNAGLLRTVAGF